MEKAKRQLEIRCMIGLETNTVHIDKSAIQTCCPSCGGIIEITDTIKSVIAHRITEE